MLKRKLAVVALTLLSFTPGASFAQDAGPPDRPVKDKWALVVGISHFQDSSINLSYAAKDAQDFCNFLVNEMHFAPDHVRLLTNSQATRENILSQIGDEYLPRVVQPDDLAVIYISSHGSPSTMDLEGINYIVANNTDKNRLYATGIPIQELSRTIKERVHSDRIMIILDACHSGAAKTAEKGLQRVTNFNADAIAQGTGQLVICSSSPSQTSWESKHYENGVFTHHLMDAFRQKPQLNDAFDYLKDNVQSEVLSDRGEMQTPVLKSKWSGSELVLKAPPTKPRTGLPPANLGPADPAPATQTQVPTTTVQIAAVPQTTQSPILVASAPPQAALPQAAAPKAAAPQVAVAVPPTTVNIPSSASAEPAAVAFGESNANGFVRIKVLDAEQKATGFFVTLEVENIGTQPVNPWGFLFQTYDKGYYMATDTHRLDLNLPPGQKAKVDFSAVEKPDELVVKFEKPNWKQLAFRLDSEGSGSPIVALPPNPPVVSDTGDFENYASNGKVRMRVLDAEQKMTGYFMTFEIENDTAEPLELYQLVFNFNKDGYFNSKTSGSGVWGADHTLPPGRRMKLIPSTVEKVDEVQIHFPKPNWTDLKLKLQ